MIDDIFELSDKELVRRCTRDIGGATKAPAGSPDPTYPTEMTRRLMVSIDRFSNTTSVFSAILGILTLGIFILTVGMWAKMGW